MTIEVTDKGFYAVAWFLPGDDMDWLAAVYRKDDASPFELTYRFRYYNPSSTNDRDNDRKSWFGAKVNSDVPSDVAMKQLITAADDIFALLQRTNFNPYGYEKYRIEMMGNGEKFLSEFMSKPFARVTRVEKRPEASGT